MRPPSHLDDAPRELSLAGASAAGAPGAAASSAGARAGDPDRPVHVESDPSEEPEDGTDETADRSMVQIAVRHAQRLVVLVIGGTLLLLGVVMLVTPGPGVLMLFVGLSVLAAEFAWARRLLRRAKVTTRWNARKAKRRFG